MVRKKPTRKKTARKAAKTTRKKTAKKKAKKAVKRTAKKAVKKKAKKTAHKRSTKRAKDRSATQRTSSRRRVYNLTKEVPQHQYFILANGQPVKHVAELAALLDQLEDHVFNHHVTPDRNDFHNWVKDVFDDMQLARKIAGVGTKKRLQLVIYKHLAGNE